MTDPWQYISNEDQFLALIVPEIKLILNSVSSKLSVVSFPVKPKNILKSIFLDLKQIWLPQIERLCVLEFQELKDKKALETENPYKTFIEILKVPEHRNFLLNKYKTLKIKLEKFQIMYLNQFSKLIQSLNKDYMELKNHFSNFNSDSSLTSLSFIGDPHDHYQRVLLLTFTKGSTITKLIYKPRSIENECRYNEFLSLLNQQLQIPLKIMHCLQKEDYGYCEYIERKSCTTKNEIEQFYWRYGALIAISYFLNITDLHYENLIANGPNPVLVDLECMALPLLSSPHSQNIPLPFQRTLLTSGLLPQYEFFEDGCIDISALNGGGAQEVPIELPQIEKDSQGNLSVKRKKIFLSEQENRPKCEDKTLHPEQFSQKIIEGFRSVYEIFIKQRERFINEILPRFYNCRSRLVLRSTHIYFTLMKEQYHPLLLYNPKQLEKHLLWVKDNTLNGIDLSNSEYLQMQNDDIPAYYVSVQSKKVHDAYGYLANINVYQTGFERLYSNFQKANEKDLEKQIKTIKDSLACLELNSSQKRKNSIKAISYQRFPNKKATDIEKAIDLLDYLQMQAFTDEGIFSYWTLHKTEEISNQKYFYLTTTGMNMYEGLIGILLPYIYISHSFGVERFKSFWQQGISGIERFLKQQLTSSHVDFGLFSGLGGIAYLCHVLYRIGAIRFAVSLENCLFQVIEKKFLTWLNAEQHSFDLINGVAGFMIALHRLNQHSTHFKAQISSLLKQCLTFLFTHYTNPFQFPAKAKTKYIGCPLLGMSHGVSGIAWVLAQIDADLETTNIWINKALDYERCHFSKTHQNWPNYVSLRNKELEENSYQVDWCHGAVGIGLNRIDMYCNGWRNSEIEKEIEIALTTTGKHMNRSNINLCHGALGTHEFFLCAKQNRWISDKVYRKVSDLIDHLTEDLNTCSTDGPSLLHIPGLMTGYSGLAYQLLRKAAPDKVPSLLLLK